MYRSVNIYSLALAFMMFWPTAKVIRETPEKYAFLLSLKLSSNASGVYHNYTLIDRLMII